MSDELTFDFRPDKRGRDIDCWAETIAQHNLAIATDGQYGIKDPAYPSHLHFEDFAPASATIQVVTAEQSRKMSLARCSEPAYMFDWAAYRQAKKIKTALGWMPDSLIVRQTVKGIK